MVGTGTTAIQLATTGAFLTIYRPYKKERKFSRSILPLLRAVLTKRLKITLTRYKCALKRVFVSTIRHLVVTCVSFQCSVRF